MKLFTAFQTGNKSAEEFIFKKFYKPLCLFAFNIVNETQAAEDIVADVFVKAFDKRNEFQEIGNIKAFLYTCVRNSCINFCKTQKKHEESVKEAAYLSSTVFDGWNNASLNEMYKAELIHKIYKEIESLPTRCREVFKLSFFKQLSSEEIAQQLSINPQTVRTQKARALQLIRLRLFKENITFAISLLTAYVSLSALSL